MDSCCDKCRTKVLTGKGWEKCYGNVNCLLTAECAAFKIENIKVIEIKETK